MKKVFFIFLFSTFSIAVCFTQTKTTEKKYIYFHNSDLEYMNPESPYCRNVSKVTALDSGFIRVIYALNATDVNNWDTYDDLQRLEIGDTHSKYYSSFVFSTDSTTTFGLIAMGNAIEAMFNEGRAVIKMMIDGKSIGWSEYLFSEYFKDFSTNELTEYARMPAGLFQSNSQYSEPIPVQNWTVSDDTLTVVGYLCQKATCKFRGRDYTAWFTTDIPISNGPWKFGGLPGLILKVYDTDNLYTFECVGIENYGEKYPITKLNSYQQYKKSDRMKVWKLKKSAQENHYQLTGMKPIDGKPFPKLYPYNPLELE
jgi:GLPGLI family protein